MAQFWNKKDFIGPVSSVKAVRQIQKTSEENAVQKKLFKTLCVLVDEDSNRPFTIAQWRMAMNELVDLFSNLEKEYLAPEKRSLIKEIKFEFENNPNVPGKKTISFLESVAKLGDLMKIKYEFSWAERIITSIPLFQGCHPVTSKKRERVVLALAIIANQKNTQPNIAISADPQFEYDSYGKVKTVLFQFKDLNLEASQQDRTLFFELAPAPNSVSAYLNIRNPYRNLNESKVFVIQGNLLKRKAAVGSQNDDINQYLINSYPVNYSFNKIAELAQNYKVAPESVKSIIIEALVRSDQYSTHNVPANAEDANKYYTGISLQSEKLYTGQTIVYANVYYCYQKEECKTVQYSQKIYLGDPAFSETQTVIDGIRDNKDFSWLKTQLGIQ